METGKRWGTIGVAQSNDEPSRLGQASDLRRRIIRGTPPWAVGLLAVAISALFVVAEPTIFQTVKLSVFDTYQRNWPRTYIPAPVRIIEIDEASLESRGQWPWPRHHMAELVTKLNGAGAAAIAFDIVFAEPDRTSPQRIAKILAENPSASGTYDDIANLRDHDSIFVEAVRKAPFVAGVILTNTEDEITGDANIFDAKTGIAHGGQDPREYLPSSLGIVSNIQEIDDAASGLGNISVRGDKDRVVRRVPLLTKFGDDVVPHLSIEALRVAERTSTVFIRSNDGSGETGGAPGIAALKVGNRIIPTASGGEIWVHYTEDVDDRFVSAANILNDTLTPDALRTKINGHIVLVGPTAPGLRDVIATPIKRIDFGVIVHANLLEQILLGNYLSRPDWAEGAEFAALLIAGAILVFGLSWTNAVSGAALVFVFVAATGGLAIAAFTQAGWLVNPVYVVGTLLFSYMLTTGWRFFATAQEKAEVREAFERYLSPQMVERIADNPDNLKLGGEVRELTILFSDIRGFTAMSEKMDPEELTNLLNRFLTPMSDALMDHDATLDKYIGDAVMAFWNAPLDVPNHQQKAAHATLAMLRRLEDVNRELAAEGGVIGRQPLRMGVGLNTGDCCVGNMGSDQRFAYSCLGDPVNLASRLEGMTKQYAVDIIIGQSTAAALSDFALLELDLIRVVGRQEPERIYALLGDESLATRAGFTTFSSNFSAALDAYRAQDWELARANFSAAAKTAPPGVQVEGLIEIFRTRIDAYLIAPPPPDWDGVYDATKK